MDKLVSESGRRGRVETEANSEGLPADELENSDFSKSMRATFTKIPEADVSFSFARSGGPGGQNVNKVNTKVVLTFNVAQSKVLTDGQKARILAESKKVRTGLIVIHSSESRSQLENKQRALEILNEHIKKILTPKKQRIPTRPTKASKEQRLATKHRRSNVKRSRSERGGPEE